MRITNNHMLSDNENNFLPKSLLNVAMVWVCPPQFTCGNLNLPCKGFKRWRQWTDSTAKRTWDADSPSLALACRPLCRSANLLPQHYSACKQCRGLGAGGCVQSLPWPAFPSATLLHSVKPALQVFNVLDGFLHFVSHLRHFKINTGFKKIRYPTNVGR